MTGSILLREFVPGFGIALNWSRHLPSSWFQRQTATVRNAWREALEPNAAIASAPLEDQLRFRFLRGLASVAFESGYRQPVSKKHERVARVKPPKARNEATASQALDKNNAPKRANHHDSTVAVVIPVLLSNQEHFKNLRQTLTCIANQSLSPAFVYLIDDGSPLPLQEQLLEEERQGLTIIQSEYNEGPAAARNKGLQAARDAGVDYVCFTDSDCLPEPSWVESIVSNFEEQPDTDILGGITSSVGDTIVDQYHDVYGTVNGRILPDGTLLYAPTCNMAVRLRTVQVSFNPVFPEAAYEDVDFALSAREQGARIRLARDVHVAHANCSTVPGLFKQLKRYGRSFPLMMDLHPSFLPLVQKTKHVPSTPPIRP